MPEVLPVQEDMDLIVDTDNLWHFAVSDENGARLDPTTWGGNLQIAKTEKSIPLVAIAWTVVTDPLDATKKVLQIPIPDSSIQPATLPPGTPDTPKVYVYSLKRTDEGFEKPLRYGKMNVFRIRL